MLNLLRTLPLLVEDFRKQEDILAVYVFGSYNDGTAYEKSDLDLGVLFRETKGLWEEMSFQARITELIHFEKVDLLNLNSAPLRLQFAVMATGKLIYERDPDQTSDFIEDVLHRYHDREFRYRVFFQEWDEGLKEDYGEDKKHKQNTNDSRALVHEDTKVQIKP